MALTTVLSIAINLSYCQYDDAELSGSGSLDPMRFSRLCGIYEFHAGKA